ncbi:Gfo/Idh/MocA family oxidoreductase [bacterium]|nr:Gfo/Idh/MocA family oxidoreductase [bacterium]
MTKVRIGVVGVGYLGSHHARILSKLPDADFVGVLDINDDASKRIANKYGCKSFDRNEDMAEAVDAVVVATPTKAHCDVASFYLERDKSVLVEKPIADSLDSAQRMIGHARRLGVKLQVGHSERFNPAFVAVSKFINGPRFIETNRLAKFGQRGLDVDVVLDLMIHDIDLVASCFPAEPCSISAVGVPVLSDSVDMANARLEFPNGSVANLIASRTSLSPLRKIRLFQPDTYISADLMTHKVKMYRRTGQVDLEKPLSMMRLSTLLKSAPVRVAKFEPLAAELEAFLKCILNNTPEVVSGEDGLRALDWAFAIKQSIDEHFRLFAANPT